MGLQAVTQYFNPWQFGDWLNSAVDAEQRFEDFATGTGPGHRSYGPGSTEVQDLKYSPGANKARDYYARCGNGRTVSGGHPFGLQGLSDSGLNPTLQFVGSYDWTISPNGDGTVTVLIQNSTSASSFFYHLIPDSWNWSRNPGSGWHLPFSTTDQTYQWTEPPSAPTTNGRKDGCQG